MSIIFDPSQVLKKIAPKRKIEKLLSKKLTFKRAALSFLDDADFIDRTRVKNVALKTIKGYRLRVAQAIVDNDFERAAGREVSAVIVDDPKQLIQRVENEIIFQVHNEIKEKYAGQKAVWLPSDADEPRPEHQANYGKEYVIGEGIDGIEPGDEPGCKCGIEILTTDTKLEL